MARYIIDEDGRTVDLQEKQASAWTTNASGDVALRTTATITGDLNIDSTSVSTGGLIGKASGTNADFTTAYASGTTLTCSSLPSGTSSINAADIVSIIQVATTGAVTNTYSRDDATITVAGTDPTTITVAGATFASSDTFVVYTNIERIYDKMDVQMLDGNNIDLGNGTVSTGTQRVTIASDTTGVLSVDDNSSSLTVDTTGTVLSVDDNSSSLTVDTTGTSGLEVVQTTAADLNVTEANSSSIQTAVELIDDTVGTIDSAFSGKVNVIGAKAESTVPTEVADADAVAQWHDTLGRQILKGTNLGQECLDVNEIAPALLQTQVITFTQLTAAGSTAVVNTEDYHNHTFSITLAAVDTSVDIRIEGSLDNSNWFNMDDTGNDTQYTTNGTYLIHKPNFKTKYVRFTFVSEVGGTAATLDVTYMGGN